MKAEVIGRGYVLEDGSEAEIGSVLEVSKARFDRSTKLIKPGSNKREISTAEKALNAGRAQLAEATKALNARAEELAEAEETLKEREEAVATKEAELAKK